MSKAPQSTGVHSIYCTVKCHVSSIILFNLSIHKCMAIIHSLHILNISYTGLVCFEFSLATTALVWLSCCTFCNFKEKLLRSCVNVSRRNQTVTLALSLGYKPTNKSWINYYTWHLLLLVTTLFSIGVCLSLHTGPHLVLLFLRLSSFKERESELYFWHSERLTFQLWIW